ncbi:hypothetical protein [Mesorhizobium sp. M0030]|uniref:hypothetical protein n=1 Tax=Mesorhizobium sp. M0030 TaxID=2956851 RepID=UPI00333CD484
MSTKSSAHKMEARHNLSWVLIKYLFRIVTFIGFMVVAAAIIFTYRLDFFAHLVADRVLANAVMPVAHEMPETTGQVSYSSEDIQIIGGRGEGLSCSLPPQLARRAFPQEAGWEPIGLQMRQACATHDYCYRHGSATYGYAQADCDFMLQEQAFRLCLFIDKASDDPTDEERSKCIRDARLVTLGVRVGGGDSFRSYRAKGETPAAEDGIVVDDHASTYFEYDPYPVRSGSYAVYRVADAPDGTEGQSKGKAVYKFSIRPSGAFVSRAADNGRFELIAVIPGDPAYLVGAPFIVRSRHNGRDEDWFVWWQRRSLEVTGGRILAIAPRRASTNDWKCLYLSAMPDAMADEGKPCNTKTTSMLTVFLGMPKHYDDIETSELVPAYYGRIKDDTLLLSALQTHSCLEGANSLCFRDISISTTSGQKLQQQEPLRVTDRFSPEVPGKKQQDNNRYRNFVSHPLILTTSDRQPVLVWLRRDADYESSASLRRMGISHKGDAPKDYTGRSRGTVELADLEESDEPLIVAGRTTSHPSLVSLRNVDKAGKQRLLVRQWHLPPLADGDENGVLPSIIADSTSCAPDLPGDWLVRPPIGIGGRDGSETIVLSRIFSKELQGENYSLQLALFTIGADGRCAGAVHLGPTLPLADLMPSDSKADKEDPAINRRRLERMRQAPILVEDMLDNGDLEVLFPDPKRGGVVIRLSRINRNMDFVQP